METNRSPEGDSCFDALERALTPDELFGFIVGSIVKCHWSAGAADVSTARWYRTWFLRYASRHYTASHAAYFRDRIDVVVEQALRAKNAS